MCGDRHPEPRVANLYSRPRPPKVKPFRVYVFVFGYELRRWPADDAELAKVPGKGPGKGPGNEGPVKGPGKGPEKGAGKGRGNAAYP